MAPMAVTPRSLTVNFRALSPVVRRTAVALASTLAFAGAAHAQAEDWQSAVAACTPANLPSLQLPIISAPGGFVRAPAGAANPQMVYTCNVLDAYFSFVPLWTHIRLQALDTVGGAVTATLYQKSKATGVSVAVAAVPSVAAGVITNSTNAIPALDFALNSYHVVVTLTPQANSRPQAHMVQLIQ